MIFSDLRALVFLRRISRSLELLANLKQQELNQPKRRTPRPVDFGELDIESINQKWREDHPDA